ncbi:MAG TPA: hypothetical protein VGH16_05290 [Candidatus Binatia bacterium]
MPGLLKRIERIFRPEANGRRESNDPLDTLKESYRELNRLAAQIADHAERAPYPAVAQTLRRVAEEKRSAANTLRDRINATGGTLYETPLDIESGGNHWERMGRDLSAHSVLETRFLERAARLNEKSPDAAELLRQVVQLQNHHVRIFMDLIARADPQAQQT